MPVTIKPSPEKAGANSDKVAQSANEILAVVALAWSSPSPTVNWRTGKEELPESRKVIQTSFSEPNLAVIPYENGLVQGIIRAFEQDLHLVIRPDDIWLSILTQFSMFVNANAEDLRHLFVEHDDKKQLMVDIRPASVWSINIGHFAQLMAGLIEKEVVDPELRSWIMPNFTTTTDNDKSVAAIVMMGTLQKYFDYLLIGGCGFPSVTLLGEKADWEEVMRRVEKLPNYGTETAEWSKLLIPVIKHMIMSFDHPSSDEVKDFWLCACNSTGSDGSLDIETISGWVTAFCFWSEQGRRLTGLSDAPVMSAFGGLSTQAGPSYATKFSDRKKLTLDGVEYPIISQRVIPPGVITVPVIIQDVTTMSEYSTTLVAGSVGMGVTAVSASESSVYPQSGWWMLEDSVKPLEF